MSGFSISSIHHTSVIVSDLSAALEFYCDLLGLQQDHSRPGLGYDGAWLTVGQQQIHLLVLPNPDPREGRPEHVGRDRHTAFAIKGLEALCERLQNAKIPYSRSQSGRKAVFCRDPDNNGLELVEI